MTYRFAGTVGGALVGTGTIPIPGVGTVTGAVVGAVGGAIVGGAIAGGGGAAVWPRDSWTK